MPAADEEGSENPTRPPHDRGHVGKVIHNDAGLEARHRSFAVFLGPFLHMLRHLQLLFQMLAKEFLVEAIIETGLFLLQLLLAILLEGFQVAVNLSALAKLEDALEASTIEFGI